VVVGWECKGTGRAEVGWRASRGIRRRLLYPPHHTPCLHSKTHRLGRHVAAVLGHGEVCEGETGSESEEGTRRPRPAPRPSARKTEECERGPQPNHPPLSLAAFIFHLSRNGSHPGGPGEPTARTQVTLTHARGGAPLASPSALVPPLKKQHHHHPQSPHLPLEKKNTGSSPSTPISPPHHHTPPPSLPHSLTPTPRTAWPAPAGWSGGRPCPWAGTPSACRPCPGQTHCPAG
jgi:hypothetical protein